MAAAAVAAVAVVAWSPAALAQTPAQPPAPEPGRVRLMSPLGLLPASFVTVHSGAQRWQVDLLPGGVYQRRVWGASGAGSGAGSATPAPRPLDEIGRYQIEGRRLMLASERDGPVVLDLQADGRLRSPLAAVGQLRRLERAAPIEPRLRLAGLFTYFADAPRIVLCADGRSLPVAPAGDYLALERAYTQARSAPGAPLWVELEGLIAPRPSMEPSQPPQTSVVVEQHLRVDPRGRCAGVVADRPLEGTEWRSTAPGSTAMLILAGGRLQGSDGCNRLVGAYAGPSSPWPLGPLATTRMACASGQVQADAFRDALARTVRHRIQGDVLELLDGAGAVLLRLQAQP